jgi:hypothetical protein
MNKALRDYRRDIIIGAFCFKDSQVTVDEGLGEQYDITLSVIISDRQHRIRSELFEFWRFSFQYGFEMTDHKRLVSQTKSRTPHAVTPGWTETQNSTERLKLWQHLYWLARQSGFCTAFVDGTNSQPAELPPLVPCDYPESIEDELPINRRYGKPDTDSVYADRFDLSREALERPWDCSRVTAGFARRSDFLAFSIIFKMSLKSKIFQTIFPKQTTLLQLELSRKLRTQTT